MGLMKWFKGLRKEDKPDEQTQPPPEPTQQRDKSAPRPTPGSQQGAKQAPEPSPPENTPPKTASKATEDKTPSVEEIKDVLDTINTVFEDEDRENTIVVPGLALLKMVPAELRGPNWDEDHYPDFELLLEKDDVLKQLKMGRVAYPASTFAPMLPHGWLAVSDATMLDLDLPLVVSSIPADQITGASEKSESYRDVEGMKSLFTPKRKPSGAIKKQMPGEAEEPEFPETYKMPEPEAAPAEEAAVEAVAPAPTPEPEPEPEPLVKPQPEPEVEAVAPAPEPEPELEPEPKPKPVTRPIAEGETEEDVFEPPLEQPERRAYAAQSYQPDGWSGVDDGSATGGININTASVEELEVLPGVGISRARDIIAMREKIGGFKHIYQLAMVPGIGSKLFKQMTGLSLTSGSPRHSTLHKLLGVEEDKKLSLADICSLLCDRIGAVGCVLSTNDGVPLAQTDTVADAADRYAAISAQLFRRTGRYLRNLTGEFVDCLALPLGDPPVLVFAKGDFYFVIVQDEKHQAMRDLKRANAILNEISWLLGKRAIVRGM